MPFPTTGSPNQTLADSYQYDAIGRRFQKTETVSDQNNPVTSNYAYLGLSTTAVSKDQSTTASGSPYINSYDYNSAEQPVGFATNVTGTDNYYSYATDANGSVIGLEGPDGTVKTDNAYHYTPYGGLELGSDQTNNPLGTDTPENTLTPDAQSNQVLFEGFQYNPAGTPDPAVQPTSTTGSGNETTAALPAAESYTMPARNYLPGQAMYQTPDQFEQSTAAETQATSPLVQDPYTFAVGNPTTNVELDGHVCEPDGGSGNCATGQVQVAGTTPQTPNPLASDYAHGTCPSGTSGCGWGSPPDANTSPQQAQFTLDEIEISNYAAQQDIHLTGGEQAGLEQAILNAMALNHGNVIVPSPQGIGILAQRAQSDGPSGCEECTGQQQRALTTTIFASMFVSTTEGLNAPRGHGGLPVMVDAVGVCGGPEDGLGEACGAIAGVAEAIGALSDSEAADVMSLESVASEDEGGALLRHYTTDEGAAGIIHDGVISESADGNTYLTPDHYSDGPSTQAGLNLNHTPTGYFEFPAPPGAPAPTPVEGGTGTEVPIPGPVRLPPGTPFNPFP